MKTRTRQLLFLALMIATLIVVIVDLVMIPSPRTYYRQIIVENVNTTCAAILYANYTINISIDTTDLSRFGSGCEDIRIIYNDSIEISRRDMGIIGCGTNDTQVWFKLQSDIQAATNDTNYKLYYGYQPKKEMKK